MTMNANEIKTAVQTAAGWAPLKVQVDHTGHVCVSLETHLLGKAASWKAIYAAARVIQAELPMVSVKKPTRQERGNHYTTRHTVDSFYVVSRG
jgi:hypothetical protein